MYIEDELKYIKIMSNKTRNTFIALVTGTLVGAGLGLLYAPQSGKKTRKQLLKEAENAKKVLEDKYDEAASQLSDFADTAKDKFEKQLDSTISEAKAKSEDVIAYLEKEFKALQEKNESLINELETKK